jgi:hypothetical protein
VPLLCFLVKSFFEVLRKIRLSLQDKTKSETAMGRKRLERPSAEQINTMISSMLEPAHVLEYFDIWDAHEYSDRWVIKMREKEGMIP